MNIRIHVPIIAFHPLKELLKQQKGILNVTSETIDNGVAIMDIVLRRSGQKSSEVSRLCEAFLVGFNLASLTAEDPGLISMEVHYVASNLRNEKVQIFVAELLTLCRELCDNEVGSNAVIWNLASFLAKWKSRLGTE